MSSKCTPLILPCLLIATGCAAGAETTHPSVELTAEGGKTDVLSGSDLQLIWPWEYDWLEFGGRAERSVRLFRYAATGRIQLEGDGVEIDFSTYVVPVPRSPCESDSDCDGGDSCDRHYDEDGQCMTLARPEGQWSLRATATDGDVPMGFVLYGREAVGPYDTLLEGTLVTCGGQNIFRQIDFTFGYDETYLRVDDAQLSFDQEECGLDFPQYVRRDMVLSALAVPLIDVNDLAEVDEWGTQPAFPHAFTLVPVR